MNEDDIKESYKQFLARKSLRELWIIGKVAGVGSPTGQNKEDLIQEIIAIVMGKKEPAPPSKKGAPSKAGEPAFDEARKTLERLKQIIGNAEYNPEKSFLYVSSGADQERVFDQKIYTGYLEITASGQGFLRAKNFRPSANGNDVVLPAADIEKYGLREGDFVSCTVKPRQKNEAPVLEKAMAINGCVLSTMRERLDFDALTPQFANEKVELSSKEGPLSLRMLDLFVPIGKGQRALITAPPKAGKTTLLKEIACAIEAQHDDISLIVLLIGERPEEVTEFRNELKRAEVVSSTFDEDAERHVRAAQFAIACAKRMAEAGNDVVILLDSLTRLSRAYRSTSEKSGNMLSDGFDTDAFAESKRFFSAARNTAEAGSITILATVSVDTNSRMDEAIYEEFKDTCNAELILSRELMERRVFPAIDLQQSGAKREDLLLSEQELEAVKQMRGAGIVQTESVIDMMKKTSDNAQLIARLPEWLKIYQNK